MPILNWLTRDEDVKAASKVPYRLLEEVPNLSYGDKNSGNMLIQGDNLEALKALLPYYAGQVKCIFIDPPYNTKSANFIHYDDNLEHTQWIAMMWPRLILLKELLSETGSLWVSVDDNEAHYLKVLLDEVFGRKNFVSNAIWQKKYSPQNDAKWLSDNHDHILIYAKDKENWRPNPLPRSDAMNNRYKNPDNDPRGPWKAADFSVKTYSEKNDYRITVPSGRVVNPPESRCWGTSEENYKNMVADNRIWFGATGNNVPSVKKFLSEVKDGVTALTIWQYNEVGHNQDAKKEVKLFNNQEVFDTPKPEKLLERIVRMATNANDIVLDSYLGSGTTAAVAAKLNRKFIGIELGEHAKTHCLPRLQKVVDGEQGGISEAVNWEGGGGFRFYQLGANAFDEEGRICPDIKFGVLAAHIWFSETNGPWGRSGGEEATSPFLGVHDGIAYGLLYNGILGDRRPDGGNVVTSKTLRIVQDDLKASHPNFDGELVIYGESSRIGEERLKRNKVTFKQTPYDVKAR
ncbi:site-specific DNA-methyltransferase [Curvivirga sp.]|uniref:site-specific DNA-methyltransferase n=1 Tax=Curvivirga sp. TaxID=2856848 RepID=UPI003B595FB1